MAEHYLTDAGFLVPTLDEIFESTKTRVRGKLGVNLPLTPDTDLGIMSGIMAEMVAEPAAVAGALYDAFNEASAGGAAQDNLAAITGSKRKQARPSKVVLTATGDVGTVLPVGRTVSVPATGIRFLTTAAATLASLPSWQSSHPYALGARVTTNVGGARVYQCMQAGASAVGGTGPSGTGTSIADGTVLWRYLGDGAAAANVAADCAVTGPVSALAYSLTAIQTPVAGWRSVTNVLDAALGADRESDADFRLRRRAELRALGKGSVAAIRELLSDEDLVPGVIAVTVFENDTGAVRDGMPPNSIEALVEGGEDQVIFDVLWDVKGDGIQAYGTTVGEALDVEGVGHTVGFTRPGILSIWEAATVQLTPDAPADNDQVLAQLYAAALAYLDSRPSGRDVVVSKASAALADISWVHDVQDFRVGLSSGTLGTANIPVSTRQRADGDTSRMAFTLERLGPEDL